jgi:hypothetical protein
VEQLGLAHAVAQNTRERQPDNPGARIRICSAHSRYRGQYQGAQAGRRVSELLPKLARHGEFPADRLQMIVRRLLGQGLGRNGFAFRGPDAANTRRSAAVGRRDWWPPRRIVKSSECRTEPGIVTNNIGSPPMVTFSKRRPRNGGYRVTVSPVTRVHSVRNKSAARFGGVYAALNRSLQ